jgi:Zn-finger nucleic acid-binding protein
MSERSGIEIDYCPQYRGVWLDRGELDKIIERSISIDGAGEQHRETTAYPHQNNHWGSSEPDDDLRGHHNHGQSYHAKKPLGKLFD